MLRDHVSFSPPLRLDQPSRAAALAALAAAALAAGASGQCGTGGNCFQTHGPFCENVLCCETVCMIDATCCSIAWDAGCASLAVSGCSPSFLAGPIVDPWTGKKLMLLTKSFWPVARVWAEGTGARLLQIVDAQENEFVRRWLVNGVPGVGVGDIWLGASDVEVEGSFEWTDGTPVLLSRWAPGEPDPSPIENYVSMFAATGEWADFVLSISQRSVFEWTMPGCNATASCFSVHPSGGCNLNTCCEAVCGFDSSCCMTAWDNDCVTAANQLCLAHTVVGPIVNPATRHTYFAVSVTAWAEGERLARLVGGHLAVPDDAAENAWIASNFLQPTTGVGGPAFIGVHDQLIETVFQSNETVAPVTFKPWAPGEPTNLGDVVKIAPGGVWKVAPVGSVAPAIIEVPCLGDLDGNQSVDGADLAILLGLWGRHPGPADLNFDGDVGAADLAFMLGSWGPCPTSNCCSPHAGGGCDQVGCSACTCSVEPFCCQVMWDANCSAIAASDCNVACQCGG